MVRLIEFNQVLKNLLLGTIIVVLLVSTSSILKWGHSLYPARTIVISGEAKAIVSPDIAKISFAVVSEGLNPETLQTDNSQKMAAAIDFIKSKGIATQDIKTINYQLSPRYEYDEKRKQSFIAGYTLSQTVLVKIRDFDKLAEIVGGLTKLSVNQINQISFEIDEPDKYLTQARAEAFKKANQKAYEMAASAGVKIKRVVNFSEYSNVPIYPNSPLGKGGEGMILDHQPLPPLEKGTEELTIQVNVTYEIE